MVFGINIPKAGRLEIRMQLDAFLKEHEIFDYTAADYEQDRETLRELRTREAPP
jgi:hypothetical protein